MKKLFILLSGMMLLGLSSKAYAENIFEWKDGTVSVRNIEAVDSITFYGDGLYNITCSEATGVTKTSFSGTATVTLASGVKSVVGVNPSRTVGLCYSFKNEEPTMNDETRYLGSEVKSYDFTLEGLVTGKTYYYRAYMILFGNVYYGEVSSVKLNEEVIVDNSCYINGHWFVDLELPSGMLWADTNIGAATAADYGDYFAWGETATKDVYSWDNYKYGTSMETLTKYNYTDGLTELEASDDAAVAAWGDQCRMPTSAEYKELLNSDYCSWSWVTMKDSNGADITGYKVTSKKNGNSIFFPTSGGHLDDALILDGQNGFFWAASVSTIEDGLYAYALNFGEGGYHFFSSYDRYHGFPVRPVASQQ